MAKDYRKKNIRKDKGSASKQMIFLLGAFLIGYVSASVFDLTSLSQWLNAQLAKGNPEPPKKVVAEVIPLPKPKLEFYTLLSHENKAGATANTSEPVSAGTLPSGQVSPSPGAQLQDGSPALQEMAREEPHAEVLKPKEEAGLSLELNQAQGGTHLATAPVEKATASRLASSEPKAPSSAVNPVKLAAVNAVHREAYLLQVASFRSRQEAEHMRAALALKGYKTNTETVMQQGVSWFRVYVGPFFSRLEVERAKVAVSRTEHVSGIIRKMKA